MLKKNLVKANIAGDSYLFTDHLNLPGRDVAFVSDVDAMITEKNFMLDKVDKPTHAEVRKNPNSILNKYN